MRAVFGHCSIVRSGIASQDLRDLSHCTTMRLKFASAASQFSICFSMLGGSLRFVRLCRLVNPNLQD